MSASTGYSLWLVPDGDVRDNLADTIAGLAREYGGPRFEPHVTVLGRLAGSEAQLVPIVERLAGQVPTFEAEFDGLGDEAVYFRSLYARVRSTPGVLALYEAARRAFDVEPAEPYRPHLSLLYGVQTIQTKQAIARTLVGRLPTSFVATAIELHLTTGPVEAWHRVLRADLTGPTRER